MRVKISRVNEDDNSFDTCLVIDGVTEDQFASARALESAADEPEEFVADLYDDRGIRETICLPRQRMPLAAAKMQTT